MQMAALSSIINPVRSQNAYKRAKALVILQFAFGFAELPKKHYL